MKALSLVWSRIRGMIPVLLLIVFPSLSQEKNGIDFMLQDLNGEYVTLRSFLDHGPVYINFWAMWCDPCRSELKVLQPLYHTYKEKGMAILSINIDDTKSLAKVKSFVNAQHYTVPVLLDPNAQVLEKLNGRLLPYSVLLNSKGDIVNVRTGYLPGDEKDIEKEIIELLDKENSGAK